MNVSPDAANRAQRPVSERLVAKEHEYLRIGASEKARSICLLTDGLNIRSLFEIGCGTGAILERLDQVGFGERYYAIEPSIEMYTYLMKHGNITRLVDAEAVTLEASRFRTHHFDLAILSHVLEHLEDPAALLIGALRVADYVLVEVPLEGNWCGNLRASIKTHITKIPRYNNSVGHIQFFSRADVDRFVRWCGGEVFRERLYNPITRPYWDYQMAVGTMRQRGYVLLTWALARLIGEQRWARFYHGHYAALVRRRPSIDDDERTRWTPVYYQR